MPTRGPGRAPKASPRGRSCGRAPWESGIAVAAVLPAAVHVVGQQDRHPPIVEVLQQHQERVPVRRLRARVAAGDGRHEGVRLDGMEEGGQRCVGPGLRRLRRLRRRRLG